VIVPSAIPAAAGPLDELLPPPVRQSEKRSFGGNSDYLRRAYYDGRGGGGAAFSPDGKFLVTASEHQGMILWEVGTGKALTQLNNSNRNDGLSSVAFTPNGKQIVASSWGGHQEGHPVGLWNVAKGERLRSLDEDVNDTPFTALTVAPDGKTIALAAGAGRRTAGGAIVLWELESGDEIGRIDGLAGADRNRREMMPMQALAYSPDGRTLAVLLDGRVQLVELATGKSRGQLTFATGTDVTADRQVVSFGSIAFAPDGRTLAVGCSNGAVRRFDLRSGRELPPLSGQTGSIVALLYTPDGKTILSYGSNGQFLSWRADAGGDWKPKAGPLPEAALEALWDSLRSDDPVDTFGCMHALTASPKEAVSYLRKRVAPVPKADLERIDRLVADLQKGDYNTRKRAVVELRKIGAPAAPAIRRTQEHGFDELLRRLVYEFENLSPSAEEMRSLRVVAVLEQIGDADARKFLEELADGAPGAALTLQAKSALDRFPKGEPETKTKPTPQALWEALTSGDSAAAYGAVRTLANQPASATLLRERLVEVTAKDIFNDDPKRVAKLIGDLDSDEFPVRDRASADLKNLGRLVAPALRKALTPNADPELKRRVQELLDECAKATPTPEVLRIGRALEALELMGGAGAREALVALSKDVHTQWVREAAAASLLRLREEKR
jgi:hypothetical protein